MSISIKHLGKKSHDLTGMLRIWGIPKWPNISETWTRNAIRVLRVEPLCVASVITATRGAPWEGVGAVVDGPLRET